MKLSKTLMFAALVASTSISAAYAGGDQAQRRIGEENAAYFAQKGQSDSGMATKKAAGDSMKQDMQNSSASQYPCGGCIYDEKAGGYVLKTPGKH